MACPISGEKKCKCLFTYNIKTTSSPKDSFRKVFSDYAYYTKLFLHSFMCDLPDTTFVTHRLITNQEDIGDLFEPYIGKKTQTLVNLLQQHVLLVADVAKAYKGNKQNIDESTAKFFENGKQLALFLSANDETKFQSLFDNYTMHNRYLVKFILLLLDKQYDQEIKLFDSYLNHVLLISDFLLNLYLQNSGNQTNNQYYAAWGDVYNTTHSAMIS